MALDSATLFTLATCITGLLGVFLVVLWLQERSVRALAWWGAAYLMGASAVTFWGTQEKLPFLTPEVPNALLFVACGMIFNGARLFHGRRILPEALLAGAFVWFSAMQFEAFVHSVQARVVLSSLVIAAYAFFTAFELGRERRGRVARWFSVAIPLLHSAVFLAPIPFCLFISSGASYRGLFALFALETMLYVVGTAFIVVVMAKERVAAVHKTAAMTDLLTGVFNRRAFLEAADRLIAQCGRKSQPLSVLLFDLDHFKSINDRFGHAVGDDALKVFAKTAAASIRATDVVARLGGEEFAAILPVTSATDAAMVADRVRAAFQATGVEISNHAMAATVSIGVATSIPPVTIEALLARADAALYRAKANGRNRVEVAADGPAPEPMPVPTVRPAAAPALVPSLGGAAVAR